MYEIQKVVECLMNKTPLRYNISSWRQLPQCKSNNSKNLHLHVTDYIDNHLLMGFRISVEHSVYGILFACVLNARGDIVTYTDPNVPAGNPVTHELTTKQILEELHKYGFFITYNPREHLPSSQLEYLMTLKGLHYDKLRVLHVHEYKNGANQARRYLVAFKSCKHRQWLNNDYSPSLKEFTDAVVEGSATNLTEICETKQYRWDWLDYVANIDDIIRDNAGDNIWDLAWNHIED